MKDNEILVRKVYDLTRVEEAPIFKNTGIGIVEERGVQTRDVAIGDRVVWIGIPTNDKVTVPEYLSERVPDGLEDSVAVFAGIGAFVIQAVRESGLTFGDRAAVLGQGILKDITSQVITSFGIHNLELALARKGDVEIDGIFVCPAGEKSISLVANSLRNKASVTVLTGGHVDMPPELLAEKALKFTHPVPTQADERDVYYPRAYVRWTTKRNMGLFLNLLTEGRTKIAI
ncbi:MAG: hypothetical protein OEU97_06360 [Dehalococcoidia bacterium]|nr:hypothetical protein [Dehalococcoidia bacterium]MDH4366654.1 hypothetical protein [Dehalococcoidia bacterium]